MKSRLTLISSENKFITIRLHLHTFVGSGTFINVKTRLHIHNNIIYAAHSTIHFLPAMHNGISERLAAKQNDCKTFPECFPCSIATESQYCTAPPTGCFAIMCMRMFPISGTTLSSIGQLHDDNCCII